MKTKDKIGDFVVNPRVPEWGPGKVLETRGPRVTVFFRDCESRPIRTIDTNVVQLEPADIDSDPFLDNLPPYNEDERASITKRVTLAEGLDKFRRHFPALFEDPEYLDAEGNERHYKWVAHELFVELLGEGSGRSLLEAGDHPELRQRLLQVDSHLNLLSPYEKMAIRDALEDEEAALRYFAALFDVIERDSLEESTYQILIAATNALPVEKGRARVASWPVLTQFPFIARPDVHMFLKPEVTKACAVRMLFDLNYQASLNIMTYKQLLTLSDHLFGLLQPLGARDYIDVQSFIWVIGAYD